MKSARKYRTILMCVGAFLLTASFVAVPEAGAAKKKAAARKKPAARKKQSKKGGVKTQFTSEDIYAQMDFTPEQQTKFDAINEKLQAALEAWDASPKGQRLADLKNAMDEAVTPTEKRQAASKGSLIRQLQTERGLIEKRFDSQFQAILTPSQKGTRLGLKLCNSITAGKLGDQLKGDQVKKLKANCMRAGAAVAKGTISPARAEAQLQSMAVGMLSDAQKKKLGIRVPPKPKKVDHRKNNRRRRNRKPSKKQVEAYKKAVAAQKAAARKAAAAKK
ncbi:MAG: hypothetical protein QGG25_05230 [Phycisphaerae bacterium]|jgi:hypothetical protein|nr:hypothetical protein [Phycisphaerae bacterium]